MSHNNYQDLFIVMVCNGAKVSSWRAYMLCIYSMAPTSPGKYFIIPDRCYMCFHNVPVYIKCILTTNNYYNTNYFTDIIVVTDT